MDLLRFTEGTTPLLVNVPHAGTHVPPELAERMTAPARALPDTDWRVDRLYAFAAKLGAGILVATHSRYVVDLNRPPDGTPLYPGATNTGVCPTETFSGEPIYRAGQDPDRAEIESRLGRYWRPYHERLAAELERLRRTFGVAVLLDAHSIRSVVPRLFDGRLPDLNLGTGGGVTADPGLERRLDAVCRDARGYSSALNGRFTGGYNTRHYGRPEARTHAVQLELAQLTYMDEDPPYAYDE
ncbi:MAG: N-formylglutamate deformylase, partial [Alphaproteobacteria bacterium]